MKPHAMASNAMVLDKIQRNGMEWNGVLALTLFAEISSLMPLEGQ